MNPLTAVLSVIQKLCLHERMKYTTWPENLPENSGSNVRMEKCDTDFRALSLLGEISFLPSRFVWIS